jgi:hypothetical protein
MEKELKSRRTAILLTPSIHTGMSKIATMKQVSFNEMVNEALAFYISINEKTIAQYDNFFGESEVFPDE